MRRFNRVLLPLLGLLSTPLCAFAQGTGAGVPAPFLPSPVPADWRPARFEGLDLHLPPDVTPIDDARDTKTWGKVDMAARRGFQIGLDFDKNPERSLKRDGGVQVGTVVMPDGHVFRRWQMTAPPDAGVQAAGEALVSDLPIRGNERLSINLVAINSDIAKMRLLYETFVSGLSLPPPGTPLRRDIFGGVLQLPFDGSWNGLTSSKPDDLWLFADDLDGHLEIALGAAQTGPMRNGTPGTPVSFLGQPAQFFAFEDGAATLEDGTGQKGQGRVVVLETCQPDGAAISFLFSGMPGFYHDARLIGPFAGGRIAMPEGAQPCAPGVLPAGAQPATGARPEILPPFDVPAPGEVLARAEGRALGGLFDYRLPPGWEIARPDTGTRIDFSGDGAQAIFARGAALHAMGGPAALLPANSFANSDLIFGWPTRRYEIVQGTQITRVYLYEHCLAGGEPLGIAFTGPQPFFESEIFGKLTRDIHLNMPEDIRPCPEDLLRPGPAAAAQAQPAPAATQSAPTQVAEVVPPPVGPPPVVPAAPDPQAMEDPDQFIAGSGGYGLYRNGRYGTVISYPASYFRPDPPPGNGDGRAFSSVDGWARFYVFAQYNAEGLSTGAQMARDIAAHGSASYQASGPGWYVISGMIGTDIYYRRVIESLSGLVQVFEISYPVARKAEFDPVVEYMAKTFGAGTD